MKKLKTTRRPPLADTGTAGVRLEGIGRKESTRTRTPIMPNGDALIMISGFLSTVPISLKAMGQLAVEREGTRWKSIMKSPPI
ncbi:MAG: hypothetical protein H6816_14180 [Phycisphaerales bacterium]|nr:hypothetical protein [Phycisphaerales bacterium]